MNQTSLSTVNISWKDFGFFLHLDFEVSSLQLTCLERVKIKSKPKPK